MVRRGAPDRQEDVPVAAADFSFVKPDLMLGFHEMLIHQKTFFFMIINAPILFLSAPLSSVRTETGWRKGGAQEGVLLARGGCSLECSWMDERTIVSWLGGF